MLFSAQLFKLVLIALLSTPLLSIGFIDLANLLLQKGEKEIPIDERVVTYDLRILVARMVVLSAVVDSIEDSFYPYHGDDRGQNFAEHLAYIVTTLASLALL